MKGTKSMANRITWIDACKGIGIFLVIIGHTTLVSTPRLHIYSFHMPMFFFLSGFLFSSKNNFKEFVFSKVKSLLVPYFAFAVISFLLFSYYQNQPIDINKFLVSTLESKRNFIYYNDPLWFLTSLFLIEIIFYFIVKFVKNKFTILLVVLIVSFLAFSELGATSGARILPWSLDQSLYYIVYFGIGYLIRYMQWFDKNLKKSIVLMGISSLYIWLIVDSTLYQKLWGFLHLPSVVQGYLSGIIWAALAISFVIYLSLFLSFSPVINFVGKNSLTLMVLHLSMAINIFNTHFREGLYLEHHPNILALFITCFSIFMLIPVSFIINNIFPFLLGKNYKWNLSKLNKKEVNFHSH
ncbi:acyltransferase family protein [Neobacillus niacini]|uniref:acyltransferase family protein n=1 Tax=Neobacillus niacini TaxID=86668 RepID=UPI002FFE8CDD